MKRIFIVLISLNIFSFINAQWISINRSCGIIDCLAFTPNEIGGTNIFAGTYSGIFLSKDNGYSWTYVNNGPDNNVSAFAILGTTIFAGTRFDGIFRSTDNGTNWASVNTGLPSDINVLSLVVNGTYLFVGTDDNGIFLSTNNGVNWTSSNIGLPVNIDIYSFSVIDSNIYAVAYQSVYISTNNGTSWNLVTGWPRNVNCITQSGDSLFAVSGNIVSLSTDDGINWSTLSSKVPAYVTSLVLRGSNLIAGTNNGIYISTNGGASWSAFNDGMTDLWINTLVTNGMDLFAGTGYNWSGGVFRLPENTTTWIAEGLTRYEKINAMAFSGNNIFVGTADHNYRGCVFLSTDEGNSWIYENRGLPSEVLTLAVKGDYLFAGTSQGGVFISTNNGVSWDNVSTGLPLAAPNFYYAVTDLAVNGNDLFAVTSDDIFLSTNNGINWTSVESDLPNYVNILVTNGNYLIAGAYNGLFVSTNNGVNWTSASTGMPSYTEIFSLKVSGTDIFSGTEEGVYLSKDNGTSWTALNTGLKSKIVRSLALNGSEIFAGTSKGVFHSTNNGTNWSDVSAGLWNNFDVNLLTVIGTNLFAAENSYGDFGKRPLSEITAIDEFSLNDLTTRFMLNQNYPNPFNPTTTISYSIPVETLRATSLHQVTLRVYDVLGREVATLVNEEKPAGNYEVNFDAGNMTSGIYFYTLKAGEFSQTKKLMLIK